MLLTKTLKSAVANAINIEGSGKLDVDQLFVKSAVVDPGPIMYRWKPRAYGRASRIRKRMSHLKIVVSTDMPAELKGKKRRRLADTGKRKKRGKSKDKK